MSRSRYVAGFAPRAPVKSPQQIRGQWIAALDAAQLVSRGEGAAYHEQPAAHLELIAALKGLAADNFPIEAWSAREIAAAFLQLGRLVMHPATLPDTRALVAPFLRAGAEVLDALFSDLRRDEAETWRGRMGERDE